MTTPQLPPIKRFKRGVTFIPTCTLPVQGGLTSLLGVTIASSVTTVDGKEHPCTVTIIDNRKFRLLISDTITAKWPIGDALWDIKFKVNGVIVVTDTVLLRIVKTATSTYL
jgi:hypothetical protein